VSEVAVIVPCYRYGHFLRDCVESVLGQPGVAVRVLIIDDASPDETRLVGAELVARDSRVEYRRHDVNQGHIATYNEGLAWATGDYTLLLSADDLLTPGALLRATQLLDAHPEVGFVHGSAITFDTNQALPAPRSEVGPAQWRVHASADWLEATCKTGHVYIRSPEVVVRTSVQRALGDYRAEFPHLADTAMWLRFAAHAPVGELVDVDQAYYRIHAENMHTRRTGRLEELRERRAVFDTLFREVGDCLPGCNRLQDLAYRRLAREALGAASHALDSADAEAPLTELVDFALGTHSGARRTLEYFGLRYRMRAPRSLSPLLRFARDRVFARLPGMRGGR